MKPEPSSNLYESTGGRCLTEDDPCPHSVCRHHLYNNAKESQVARASLTRITCTLKLARRGGMNLEEVANLIGITRERVRQIELAGVTKMRKQLEKLGLSGEVDEILYQMNNRGS